MDERRAIKIFSALLFSAAPEGKQGDKDCLDQKNLLSQSKKPILNPEQRQKNQQNAESRTFRPTGAHIEMIRVAPHLHILAPDAEFEFSCKSLFLNQEQQVIILNANVKVRNSWTKDRRW